VAGGCYVIDFKVGQSFGEPQDVMVDGDFVGNSPSTLKLTSGKHTVTVKMSGYADWSKDITVQSGSEVQLTANLEKQSPQLF